MYWKNNCARRGGERLKHGKGGGQNKNKNKKQQEEKKEKKKIKQQISSKALPLTVGGYL